MLRRSADAAESLARSNLCTALVTHRYVLTTHPLAISNPNRSKLVVTKFPVAYVLLSIYLLDNIKAQKGFSDDDFVSVAQWLAITRQKASPAIDERAIG